MSDAADAPVHSPKAALAAWRVSLRCAEWKQVRQLAEFHAVKGYIVLNAQRPPSVRGPVEILLGLPQGKAVRLRGTVQQVQKTKVRVKLDGAHESELRRLSKSAPAAPSQRPVVPPGPAATAVGIDFGTSYTSVSVAIGDRVKVIPDQAGRTLLPSLVAFPEEGPPVVGWQARPLLIRDPRRAVASPKRLLGRKFSDPTVAGLLQTAAFKSHHGINEMIMVEIDEDSRSIIEICSMIISHAREVAERYLGSKVRQAVFTVPVGYGGREREALQRAAKLARIEVIELMEEPVAGALAYGMGKQKNEIVAVYDFGGGTFDFSILDFVHDHFRVIGTQGDPWLGGDDFDSALAQHVADLFWRSHQIELQKRAVEWQRLRIACEGVKRKLSEVEEANLDVEAIVDSPTRIDIHQAITRDQLEQLCQELMVRSLSVCKEALESVGLDPEDVTEIVMTGGVSCIPMVRKGVSEFFGREVTQTVNPEQAIALGAGLRAAQKVNHPVRGIA